MLILASAPSLCAQVTLRYKFCSSCQHAMQIRKNRITYSCCCACQVKTHSIIIATGATAKKLGIPSEEKFWSQGISACAICDGMRILLLLVVSLSLQQYNVTNLFYRSALTPWTTTLISAVPTYAPAAALMRLHIVGIACYHRVLLTLLCRALLQVQAIPLGTKS